MVEMSESMFGIYVIYALGALAVITWGSVCAWADRSEFGAQMRMQVLSVLAAPAWPLGAIFGLYWVVAKVGYALCRWGAWEMEQYGFRRLRRMLQDAAVDDYEQPDLGPHRTAPPACPTCGRGVE